MKSDEDLIQNIGALVSSAEVRPLPYEQAVHRAAITLHTISGITESLLRGLEGLRLVMVAPVGRGPDHHNPLSVPEGMTHVEIAFDIVSCGRDGGSQPSYTLQLRPTRTEGFANHVAFRMIAEDVERFRSQFPRQEDGLWERYPETRVGANWHYAQDIVELRLADKPGRMGSFGFPNSAHRHRPLISFETVVAWMSEAVSPISAAQSEPEPPPTTEFDDAPPTEETPLPIVEAVLVDDPPQEKPAHWIERIERSLAPPIVPMSRDKTVPMPYCGDGNGPVVEFHK